jgi:hypothetical protein
VTTVNSWRTLTVSLAVVLVAACGAIRPGPAATVERFYRHVEAGKIDNAIDLISSSLTQLFGDKIRSGIAEQSREIRSKGGISSIRIEQETVTGDTAEVVVIITFGNGSTQRDTSKLIRENGKWRITADK